jgi:FAD:protein FMN transferase
MSTPCEVVLYAADKPQADSCARAVLEEAKRLERTYSYYREDSLLGRINARILDTLDTETKNLLQRARQYCAATGGIFDITVATFKPLYSEDLDLQTLEARKTALLPYVGCDRFALKKNKIVFDNPHTRIDLGGFVKEYAVDRAAGLIQKAKIAAALVNFGGDMYALGRKPDGAPFRIGITDPSHPETHITYVELENEALTTSASYERGYEVAGRRFSHILETAEHPDKPLSVSVISRNCVESGVYSTALMIDPTLKCPHPKLIIDAHGTLQRIGFEH